MPRPPCSSVRPIPLPEASFSASSRPAAMPPGRLRYAWRAVLFTLIVTLSLVLPAVSPTASLAHARAPSPARAPIEGMSIDVTDGDTFVLRDDLGQRVRVRIAGIDAPESSQAWADRSRQHLRELLRDRRVRLEPIKPDPYGRLVARVWVPEPSAQGTVSLDAGLAQIEAGLAWHFTRYRRDQSEEEFERYARAERDARVQGAGLWAGAEPEPPWTYRARTRSRRP